MWRHMHRHIDQWPCFSFESKLFSICRCLLSDFDLFLTKILQLIHGAFSIFCTLYAIMITHERRKRNKRLVMICIDAAASPGIKPTVQVILESQESLHPWAWFKWRTTPKTML